MIKLRGFYTNHKLRTHRLHGPLLGAQGLPEELHTEQQRQQQQEVSPIPHVKLPSFAPRGQFVYPPPFQPQQDQNIPPFVPRGQFLPPLPPPFEHYQDHEQNHPVPAPSPAMSVLSIDGVHLDPFLPEPPWDQTIGDFPDLLALTDESK